MRGPVPFCLVAAVLGACTKEFPNPDAQTGNHPPPRVIPGGGIGDGPIDGVANLYVIDDQTRAPIPGATVRIGTLDGKTDAAGLFVATGVTGPQTVIARATGYRSEMWIGPNGANLTIDLHPAVSPPPGRANLAGQILGFEGIAVAAGHAKLATVVYSQSDDLGDAANNLPTFADANTCVVVTAAGSCNFTVTARAGHVGLIAAIFDRDLHGTADLSDDTMTLIRWAVRPGIVVTDGVNRTGQHLTLIDPTSTQATTIDFGSPPSALSSVAGVVGIDTATDGIYQLPTLQTPSAATLMVPSLAALGGTAYRLTAIAQDGSLLSPIQSIVLRRGLTGSSLSAGSWLPPPTSVSLTRTSATWTAVPDAAVVGIEFSQGSATVTRLLALTVFDRSTSVTIPELVALPTGVIDAKLSAIGATGLDLASFALDLDREKLDRVAATPVTLTN
jgi:hypothetical protein